MEGLENVREETVSTPFGAPSDKCDIASAIVRLAQL
jgi:hypothetical protein